MKKYYIRMLPDFAKVYIQDMVQQYSLQASHDAYLHVISGPHVYFTVADFPITHIQITPEMFEGGFCGQAGCGEASYEGMFVYLSETSKGVMFAEDISAMYCAGIPLIYTGEDDTPSDPSHIALQLCEEPNPRAIFHLPDNIESMGWVLMVLGTCESRFGSDYIINCTYADVLQRKLSVEGLAVLSFDAQGYIFVMKKACFDRLYADKEYLGHGLDWHSFPR